MDKLDGFDKLDGLDKLDELFNDINKYKTIRKSAKKYIKYRNLKKVNICKRNIIEDDLPIQADIGSLFLINGDNIVEFYAYYDPCMTVSIKHSFKRSLWVGTVKPINITNGDNYNLKFILDGCEKIYYADTYKYLIISLYGDGFQMYVI